MIQKKDSYQTVRLTRLYHLVCVLILAFVLFLLSFLWLWSHPSTSYATRIHYVSAAGGVDSANCALGTPCATIQQALANANSGDEIRVAAGTYTENTLLINTNLTLRGGFTTTNWIIPDATTNQTIIQANSGRVIRVNGSGVVATVSGFHVTGGIAADDDGGGGVFNQNGTLTLSDNKIYNNVAPSTSGSGGGVTNGSSSTGEAATLYMYRNDVYSNSAESGGGGINIFRGDATIDGNKIYSNTSGSVGGGIFIETGGQVTLSNNLIYTNSAGTSTGGGVQILGTGTTLLENNTIYKNIAPNNLGGGLVAAGSVVTMTNNLVISNSATTRGGGVISATNLSLVSNDFFGNTPDNLASSVTLNPTTIGSDNRITNPVFIDASNFDLRLSSPASPAIDSGDGAVSVTADFEGEGRPFGGAIDRGADEYTAVSDCYARLDNGQVYENVQTAIDNAAPGETVRVAGRCVGVATTGGVDQTAYISKSLTVRGGYTVTDWLEPAYGPTIFDAGDGGRAVYITGTSAIVVALENLQLTGGAASDGAGVFIGDNVNATLQNNVIYGNDATNDGGGVYVTGGSNATLQHNTIDGNTATNNGGAIYAESGSGTVALRNSIVTNNSASGDGGGVFGPTTGKFTLSYNNFNGNTPNNYGNSISAGATDISASPDFVNAAGGDFHVTAQSAVVGAADPASPVSVDFENDDRPQGQTADIGADESVFYAAVALSQALEGERLVTDTTTIEGAFITFTHVITNLSILGAVTDDFTITTSNSDGWPVSLNGISDTPTLTAGVPVAFEVVVSVPVSLGSTVFNRTQITATSQTNSNAFAVVEDVISNPGVVLTTTYTGDKNVNPGTVITYTMRLTNTGPNTDTYDLSFGSTLGWAKLLTPTVVTVPSRGVVPLILRIEVDDIAAALSEDVLTVTAASLIFDNVTDTLTDTFIANSTIGNRYVRAADGFDTNNNCTDNAQPCASIGHALGQSTPGDTIFVAQGTYQDRNLLLNKNVDLRGGRNNSFGVPSGGIDPALTIIDAQNAARALRIRTATLPPSLDPPTVEGFTIINGSSASGGGAIYIEGSGSVTLTKMAVLTSATTGDGGGIYIRSGSPILQEVAISSTVAGGQGGGIFIQSGSSPKLDAVSVSGAGADDGGGIYNESFNLSMTRLQLTNNQVSGRGGGLYNAGGTLTISQTRVSSNSAASGGGVYNNGGTLNLWNNYIYFNTVTAGGGGVYNSGQVNLVNDTLAGNQAATFGGGVYHNNGASLVISNTILAENTAATGGGLYHTGGSAALAFNNFWNNSAATSPQSNVGLGPNSISADPLFTDAATGDFRLRTGSPAIDVADPNTFLSLDIEDDPRPSDQGFDMGADERSGCIAQVVNSAGDFVSGPYGVLQNAVDSAPDDHIIQISGTCRGVQPRLVGGELISQTVILSDSARALTLQGGFTSDFSANDPVANPTFIIAEGEGRAMVITGTDVTLIDLTVAQGQAQGLEDVGGAIYHANSELTLKGVVISNSQAIRGGGLYSFEGDLSVTPSDNFTETQFIGNSATDGAGLYVTSSLSTTTAVISATTFIQNTATQDGGGFYNDAVAGVDLIGTGFFSNTALTGGALYNSGELLTSRRITVTNNSATGDGGGLYNASGGGLSLQQSLLLANDAVDGAGLYNTGALTMVNTIVASNTAATSGGGLYNESANAVVYFDTFFANQAGTAGGAILNNAPGAATINSTNIVSNTAPTGGGISNVDAQPDFRYNNLFGNSADFTPDGTNLSADPNFIATDPAGPSFLRIQSPTLIEDAADPSFSLSVTVDIDDNPRPSNRNFDIGVSEIAGCFVRNARTAIVYGNMQIAIDASQPDDLLQVAGTCAGVNSVFDAGAGQTVDQTAFIFKSLTLEGGYNADNWAIAPDPAVYTSTLDALDSGRVVYITGSPVVKLTGLHLRQGNETDGGAILVNSGVLTLTQNLIYSSTATNGGALYNQNGTLYLYDDNEIFGNIGTSGGAIHSAGGQIILDDNQLYDNQATDGGAFYHAGGATTLQNNIIRDNGAVQGAGVYVNAPGAVVRHNTFYNNNATGQGGGFFTLDPSAVLLNNIFRNNTATAGGDDGDAIFGPAGFTPDFNNASPGGEADLYGGGVSPGAGSSTLIGVDPLLVDPAGGNFHLQDTSPVLDQGDPTMEPIFDFEGHLRPGDQGFDIGADERLGCLAKNLDNGGVIYGNLQRAIDNSSPGDNIRVAVGACRGVNNLGGSAQTIHVTQNLLIDGQYERPVFVDPFQGYQAPNFTSKVGTGVPPTSPGLSGVTISNTTIISPAGLGRGIVIDNDAEVEMESLLVVGGDASGLGGDAGGGDAGGGVYVTGGSTAVLRYIDTYSNTATYGGGFYNDGTTSLLGAYTFLNSATEGGAIFNATGIFTVTTDNSGATDFSSWLYQNSADRGGAIYNRSGDLRLINTIPGPGDTIDTLEQNSATDAGGGVYIAGGVLTAEGFVFDSNDALNSGGAIHNEGGTITLQENNFEGNSVTDNNGTGGGLYNNSTARVYRGNEFYANSTNQDGGAIYNDAGGDLELQNTMLYENIALSDGGAVYDAGGSGSIIHNTFDQNTATGGQGGAVYLASGQNQTMKSNIFSDNDAGSGGSALRVDTNGGSLVLDYNDYWTASGTSQVSGTSPGANSLNENPQYVTANPGDDDYLHLEAFSAVIDQAEDVSISGITEDFDADPRPVNGAPDMGADEYTACLAQAWNGGTPLDDVRGSITAALADAQSGDTIRVAIGTCEEQLNIDKAVTIWGDYVANPDGLTSRYDITEHYIDSVIRLPDGDTGPVVNIAASVTSVSMDRIEITNGNNSGGNGGGIFTRADDLNLSQMKIRGSTADSGGGIYVEAGNVNVSLVSISDNRATSCGGGISVQNDAYLFLTASPVISNTASTGGGVCVEDSSVLDIVNSRVEENLASGGDGGGIYANSSGSMEFINLGMYMNNTSDQGGGLYRAGSGATQIYHATIRENGAENGGGAVFNTTGASMVISASIVTSNTTRTAGDPGVEGSTSLAYNLYWPNDNNSGGSDVLEAPPEFLPFYTYELDHISPAINSVPDDASDVDFDKIGDPRNNPSRHMCAVDRGRDEYDVERALTWLTSTPPYARVLAPTESFTYTFHLKNNSIHWINQQASPKRFEPPGPGTGYTETVTIDLVGTQPWSRTIVNLLGGSNVITGQNNLTATFDLGPGEVVTASVEVTVPAGTFANVVDVTSFSYSAVPFGCTFPELTGNSNGATTTVELARLFELGPNNFRLEPVKPGQTITYSHILTNTGNITDTYAIGPGNAYYSTATVFEPASGEIVDLAPGMTATVIYSVTIENNAAGGLTDRNSVRAISVGDPSLFTSAFSETPIDFTTGTRYVSLSGSEDDTFNVEELIGGLVLKDNNCTDTGLVCRTIQHALDQAAPNDLIKIETGVYSTVLTDVITTTYNSQVITQVAFIDKAITLQGGYESDNWDEDPPSHISHTTTLDLQNVSAGRGIFVTNNPTDTVAIDRLIIANGNAAQGGAIYNEGADLELTILRLQNNNAAEGGALYSENGNLLLQNSYLHDNQTTNDGGAVYVNNGAATVENNTFYRNDGQNGSALYIDAGTLAVSNTIFADNTSGTAVNGNPGSASLDYNLYHNNAGGDTGGGIPAPGAGVGNDTSGDPLFVNQGANPPDLHIASGSAARDSGDPDTSLNIDYDNDDRPLPEFGQFDKGADERVPVRGITFITDTFTLTSTGATVVITHTLTNSGDVTETVTLTASSNLPWLDTVEPALGTPFLLADTATQIVTATYQVPLTATGLTNITFITATTTNTSTFDVVRDEIKARGPAWTIDKAADPADVVQPGEQITYTLFITNTGDLTATQDFTVTDLLPLTYTTFVNADPSPLDSGANPLQWGLSNNVGISQSTSITLVVAVNNVITDGIAIVNDTYSVVGGGAANPAVGDPVTVTVESSVDLAIAKTASANPVQPGSLFTYTLTINNNSASGPALGVVVTDTLPAEVSLQNVGFVAPATGTTNIAGRDIEWQLTSPVAPGGAAQVQAAVLLTSPLAAGSTLTNTFGVTAGNASTAQFGAITTAVTTTNNITLSKTVVPSNTVPGGVVTYTITLTNSGNGVAAVALTDDLAPGFSPSKVFTTVTVPGNQGVETVVFTAAAPTSNGTYDNLLITATYDISQTTLANTAPVTVSAAVIDFSSVRYEVAEGAGQAVISLTLNAPSSLPASVEYATADGTAIAGSDYTAVLTNTLVFTPGVTEVSFTVPISQDSVVEGDETVILRLANPLTATLATTTTTLTILDDDSVPGVAFSSLEYPVVEDAGLVTATIILTAPSQLPVTLRYGVIDFTATLTDDYIFAEAADGKEITFAPLTTAIPITFPIVDDLLYETDERFGIIIVKTSVVNAIPPDDNIADVLIIDNDDAQIPAVSLSSPAYTVDEGVGTALITITLSSVAGAEVDVEYNTFDNTAVSPDDYTGTSGLNLATIAKGDTQTTVSIPIVDDAQFESTETFTFSISNPVSATLGTPSTATVSITDNDSSPVADFAVETFSVDEEVGAAVITVTLGATSSVATSVDYTTGGGTAAANVDYTPQSGALNFPANTTVATFTVPITDDLLFEQDETVTLTLSGPNAGTTTNPATLVIVDNDPVLVDFERSAFSVAEESGPAVITVTLATPISTTARVSYTLVGGVDPGIATPGVDYADVSGTAVFPANTTVATFTVPITDDGALEGSEIVTLSLSSPVSASLVGAPNNPAILTILDNEAGTVDFSRSSYSVAEDAGTAAITVTLSATSTEIVSVDYATSDGTAIAGQDYEAAGGTLTFSPGITLQTFAVTITNDSLFELDETLDLTLFNPVRANVGSTSPATLTIVADSVSPDPAPQVDFDQASYSVDETAGTAAISVTLSTVSEVTATVAYSTTDDTAVAGSDYTAAGGVVSFSPGVTATTFTVPISDDAVFEGNETLTLTLSSPVSATLAGVNNPAQLTIVEDEASPTVAFQTGSYTVAENQGPAVITVTLTPASTVTATVAYAAADGTATSLEDYVPTGGVLTFAPGTSALTFTVGITDDALYEADEDVALALSAPMNATLGLSNANLTILDDDATALPQITFDPDSYTVDEAAGTTTIFVTLSPASGVTATVAYSSADNTAAAGSDYTAVDSTLSFSPGQTQQSFTVPITDDTDIESDESLILGLLNPISATLGLTDTAVLTITDNDTPTVGFSAADYSVDETAGTAVITVTLSPASAGPATVAYDTSDGTATVAGNDYVTATGVLTFNVGETEQTFSVTINDDLLFEGNETISLTLSNAVGANLGADQATLTILDDDTSTLDFSAATYSVDESAGSAAITVTLSAALPVTASVAYATSDGTASAGQDYVAASDTLTFTPGITLQTFTVAITDDLAVEGNETLTLTLSNPVSATLGLDTAILTILDDDDAPDRPRLIAPPDGTLTNNNSVDLIWSRVTQAATYTVYLTPTGVFSIANPATGSTVVSSTVLADGVYTWTVAAVSQAGLTSGITDTWVFTVDTTAPLTPALIAPANGTITNSTGITFAWSSSPDASFYNLRLTHQSGPTTFAPFVSNSGFLNLPNGDGVYTWTVEAVDTAGNASGYGQPFTLTLDTTPPPLPALLTPADGAAITQTTDVTFTWSAVVDALSNPVTYTLIISGQPSQVVGALTQTAVTLPGDGVYTWTVRVADQLGNAAEASPFSFTIDTTPPDAPDLVSPPDGFLTNNPSVLFDWTDVVDVGPISYTLVITDPGATSTISPTLSSSLLGTLTGGDGVYTWTVGAVDAYGRATYTGTRTLTLDTTPPTSPALITPPDGAVFTETNVVPFEWTTSTDLLSPPVTYTLSISGQPLQLLAGTTETLALSDGVYTWTVSATDQAGNTAITDTISFTVDVTPPEIPSLISPPDQTYTNNPNVTFMWTPVADALTYTLKVTDTLYPVTGLPMRAFTGLSDGVYTWTVRSIDTYSRTLGYTDTWSVTVDTTPPSAFSLVQPSNGAVISTTRRPAFAWTDSLDTLSGPVSYTLVLTDSSNMATTFVTTSTTFTPTTDLALGDYTWLVRAQDRAGNVTVSSEVFGFTLEAGITPTYFPLILKDIRPEPRPEPEFPDLVITDFTVRQISGNTYEFQVTAFNQSTIDVAGTNNFHVAVYDVNDLTTPLVIWGVQGEWFFAGQGRTLTQNYTFSGPATFDLRAWADPFNVVVEQVETNNTRDLAITVTTAGDATTSQSNPVIPSGPLPTPTPIP